MSCLIRPVSKHARGGVANSMNSIFRQRGHASFFDWKAPTQSGHVGLEHSDASLRISNDMCGWPTHSHFLAPLKGSNKRGRVGWTALANTPPTKSVVVTTDEGALEHDKETIGATNGPRPGEELVVQAAVPPKLRPPS